MASCPSCGAHMGADHRFCTACGSPMLGDRVEAEQTQADSGAAPAASARPEMGDKRALAAREMDTRVARAAQKHDVWALVPLANEYAAGPVGAQAAQALVALIPELESRRRMNELSFILTLDVAENLRGAVTAAVDALVAIGPKAKQFVSARATSAAGQKHAAQYFVGIGYDAAAKELLSRAAQATRAEEEGRLFLGAAKYLGGCPELGPPRSGLLSLTSTHVLLGTERLLALADVAGVEIGGGLAAKSRLLPTLAFGAIGALAAKGVKDRAEIVLHLKSGDAAFFFVDSSAVEVRASLAPLLKQIGIPFRDEWGQGAMASKAPAVAGGSPTIADELTKLARLFESGFLTADELAAAKAKLLS